MTWYFVPRILSAFISIVILVVMTRVLGPAEFGRYNITLLFGTMLFSFTFFWLVISVGRFHHTKEFEGETIATALGATFLISILLLTTAGAARLILPDSWFDSLFYAAIYCIGHAIHELGAVCLRQYNEGPKYAAITLLRYTLGVFLAVVLILNGGGYKGAIAGMSLAAALTGAYALGVALRRSGLVFPGRSSTRAFFFFGFPLAVVSSSSTFFAMASQLSLSFLVGMDSVGYFAAAQSLATRTVRMPMGTLMSVVSPSVFKAQETNGTASSDAVLKRYFSFLMLISMPILVALICAADVISKLLFETDFAGKTAGNMRVLALASFILGLQGAYFSFAFTRSKKTMLQLGITFGTLVVHIVLSFVIVYLFGAHGASYAFLLSGIVGLLTFYFFGKKIDSIKLPLEEFTKTLVGTFAFVPFGLLANFTTILPVQLALLAIGGAAMLYLLVSIKQTAAMATWEKAKLLFFHSSFSTK